MILRNSLPRDLALHRPILDYFKGNLLTTDESILVKGFSRLIGIRFLFVHWNAHPCGL